MSRNKSTAMHAAFLLLPFLFLSPIIAAATSASSPPPYTPTDYIFLDCGSSSSTTPTPDTDNRNWSPDRPYIQQTTTISSTTPLPPTNTLTTPFTTARITNSSLTYSLPAKNPGPKFLRLYFYPSTYSNIKPSSFSFTVTANTFILLQNFNPVLTRTSRTPYVLEYMVHVPKNLLNLTFHPSPNSHAFINGIELVSMPYNLYTKTHQSSAGNENTFIPLDKNNTALETMFRLNVGGNDVSDVHDTGMFRKWYQDDDYIYGGGKGTTSDDTYNISITYTDDTPAYTAPEIVYATFRSMGPNYAINKNSNLTWVFSVDTEFYYLIRLHFCETLVKDVTRRNQRVFSIFINNQTAEEEADVINWSGGVGIPVYRDYMVFVTNKNKIKSKENLWLELKPRSDRETECVDSILNGVEIFKLNNSVGSLAGVNPESKVLSPEPHQKTPEEYKKSKKRRVVVMVAVIGGVLGGLFALSVFCLLSLRRRREDEKSTTEETSKTLWTPFSFKSTNMSLQLLDHCRYFTIAEIKDATCNFDTLFMIGSGGFGNVYRGDIDGGKTVAIKRLSTSSKQGAREFRNEIDLLSKLRHEHVVSLIGYCDDQDEMILVYEYMTRGTLRDHLYKTKNPPLSWKLRLEICIGAARGLEYLHAGAKRVIIHRDVKTTNVLLDGNWVAKVSDFGLSKTGPSTGIDTHVSTAVRGSIGYVDPEYYRRKKLTKKSDVYSFGVVLFEVLCARSAVIPGLRKEQVNLAVWGRNCYKSGTLDEIMDPHLKAEVAPECLNKFGEVAEMCVRDEGNERPKMSEVVRLLEIALQLQEDSEKKGMINGGGSINVGQDGNNNSRIPHGSETVGDSGDFFSASSGHVADSKSSLSSGGGGVSPFKTMD